MTDLRHLREHGGMPYYAFEATHVCGHVKDHTREVPSAPLTVEWMAGVRQRAERQPCDECAPTWQVRRPAKRVPPPKRQRG